MAAIPSKGIRTKEVTDPLLDALRTITKQPNATATQLAQQLMAGSQRVEIVKTSQLQNDVPFAKTSELQQAIAAQNLAKVATTGDYGDLKNQPFIPKTAADVGAATADQGAKADAAASAASLGKVAFSNSFNDLDDKPALEKGDKGDPGDPGPAGAQGNPGNNGQDGRAVQLQVSGGFIQWRLVGDANWQNLIATSALVGADGKAATIAVGTVTQLAAGAIPTVTNSGSSSSATFNFGIPTGQPGTRGADGISYTPQIPQARTISPATAYQHTDPTKPARVVVNARATQSVTLLALTAADKVELRIGPTAASVLSSTTGYQVGVWESAITGLSVMIGASVQDGGQLTADLPAGWYFAVNRISGTNAQIVNCFTQSMTA